MVKSSEKKKIIQPQHHTPVLTSSPSQKDSSSAGYLSKCLILHTAVCTHSACSSIEMKGMLQEPGKEGSLADSDFWWSESWSESHKNEGNDRGGISSILYTVLGVCNDTTKNYYELFQYVKLDILLNNLYCKNRRNYATDTI